MNSFARCAVCLALMGALSFALGRVLPKRWFRYDHFPFRLYPFEREGAIYNTLCVRRWKDIVPDMSRILPWAIPSKRLPKALTVDRLLLMLQETCIAEFTHGGLCLAGFVCVPIWPGAGGWTVSILFALGNLPFVIIQRFNRPKLLRLMERVRKREAQE